MSAGAKLGREDFGLGSKEKKERAERSKKDKKEPGNFLNAKKKKPFLHLFLISPPFKCSHLMTAEQHDGSEEARRAWRSLRGCNARERKEKKNKEEK